MVRESRFSHWICMLVVTCCAGVVAPSPAGAEPAAADDFWAGIKDISLNADDTVSLSLGGQARVRWEHWENFGFAGANDDDFVLFLLLFHGDLQVGSSARVFVEGKSALATERDLPGGRRALDEDSLDLQQAYLEWKVKDGGAAPLSMRLGRQELQFGKQRLVSPLGWSNTRRTWDGIRLTSSLAGWNVDPFFTLFAPVQPHEFNDPDSDILFYGVYATRPLAKGQAADLYFLGLDREPAAFGGVSGDEERYTLGGRVGGTVAESSFDFDLEAALQFGDQADRDILAWFLASQVGYTLPDLPARPRVHLGFDYASGDSNPEDGDLETFNQLFPLGHAFLGYIDVVGRQNIVSTSQGVSLVPIEKVTAKLAHHFFWRAEEEDALYNAGGGVVRAGDTGVDDEIGTELDLTLVYALDPHSTLLLGYSHFFAGDFIAESGAGEDIDFVYGSLQYTF